jgi:hypothetical protein
MNARKFAIAAVALAAALGAGWAEAHGRDDVQWSVTIGASNPGWAVQPGQAYAAPLPARSYDREYRRPTRWDRDGDGIPNRYDRIYNPRWDRDGDGIPNRYDHYDNLRHRRDR